LFFGVVNSLFNTDISAKVYNLLCHKISKEKPMAEISAKPIKIKPEEIRIEKLGEVHLEKIKPFNSYEPELVDFLMEDALNQQKRKISVTYLWFKRDTDEFIGYITLSPDCVKLKRIDERLAQRFRDKGINYKSLPALKIGRLCVDDTFLRKGVGTLMIQFAIGIAKEICGHGMQIFISRRKKKS